MDSSSPVPPAPGEPGRGQLPEAFYSLAWTIDPLPLAQFFAEYWEQKTLLLKRSKPDYYTSLLSIDEIDRVLTTLNLHHPDVSMVNARKELKSSSYTYPSGMIDVARLYQGFADGATIILSQLHMLVPELAQYCRALEREFSTRFQTNIYLTPGGNSQGFKAHYDSHDVFVLQVTGRKKWKIFDTPIELPLRAQDFDPETHLPGDVTMEFDLEPGDMCYIPRGVMHAAESDNELSLHITVGVIARTWTDLLLETLSAVALKDPAFRKMLPPGFALPGFDRSAAEETYKALVEKFAAVGNFERAPSAAARPDPADPQRRHPRRRQRGRRPAGAGLSHHRKGRLGHRNLLRVRHQLPRSRSRFCPFRAGDAEVQGRRSAGRSRRRGQDRPRAPADPRRNPAALLDRVPGPAAACEW